MKKLMQSFVPARILTIFIVLTGLLATGCESNVSETVGDLFTNPFSSKDDDEEDKKEEVINVISLKPQEIPWHIQATVAATFQRLKDRDPTAIDDEFSLVGSAGIAVDLNSSFEGFGVQNVQLNDFFHPKEAPEINRLGARLILVDPTGRRQAVSFVADYELADDKVVLKGHQWGYARPEVPLVETYIVPLAALEKLDEASVGDYTKFRSHVLSNAVVTGDPAATESTAEYSIVTFMMDRILEGDKFEIRTSAVKDGTEGFSEDSRYILHDNGWATGIIPGSFSLAGSKSFWVKAVYTPKEREEGGFFSNLLTSEKLIGLYNTANLTDSPS